MKPGRRLRQRIGLAVILTCGLLAAACGGGGTTGGTPDQFTAGLFSDLSGRNFWSVFGPNQTVWNAYSTADTLGSLFTYTPRLEWVPMLAAADPTPLEQGDDGLWRSRVTLKPDILWSDGTSFTARDVAFTFGAIARLGANRLGGDFPTMAPEDLLVRVEAIDDLTVEFALQREDARYKFGILLYGFVVQQAYWEPLVEQALASSDPLNALFEVEPTDEPVTGPYRFGTWERGSFVNRPANPRYSRLGSVDRSYANGAVEQVAADGTVLWTGNGEPGGDVALEFARGRTVNTLHYQIYGTQATGVLALQAGEVDYLYNPLGLEKGFQDQLRGVDGITLIENPTNGIRYMGFNLRRPPMNRLPFRQAVATLIDREFVTDRVLQGVAYPVYSVIPPGNAFWHNANVTMYGAGLSRADRIREAVRLLRADGFTWAQEPVLDASGAVTTPGSGLRSPNGQLVPELELLGPGDAYDPLRATFGSWIERWLNEVGIPVRANLTAFNVVSDRVIEQQDFDLWILGWSLNPYPSHLESFFHSRHTGLNDLNAQGYENPAYDEAVDAFLQESRDMNRARTLALELQEMLARDLPYVVLFDTPIVEAYRSDRVRFPTTEGLGGIQYQVLLRNDFLASIQSIQ